MSRNVQSSSSLGQKREVTLDILPLIFFTFMNCTSVFYCISIQNLKFRLFIDKLDTFLLFQGPDIRLILTWGPSPSDLDSYVKFFDASGNEECKLYWNNKACGDYATLDVDETNVRKYLVSDSLQL